MTDEVCPSQRAVLTIGCGECRGWNIYKKLHQKKWANILMNCFFNFMSADKDRKSFPPSSPQSPLPQQALQRMRSQFPELNRNAPAITGHF